MEKIPLLKISKDALSKKIFGRTEAQIRERFTGEELEKELETLPTEDEQDWMRVWQSTAAGLERVKRKMQICAFVEVDEFREDFFSYAYANDKYEVHAPFNSLKCSECLETSVHSAIEEMCRQSCVKVNGMVIDLKKANLGVDAIQLLVRTINQFFFQIYMG